MITFLPDGYSRETISIYDQPDIENMLMNCDRNDNPYYYINIYYNNRVHNNDSTINNTEAFLHDVAYIARHPQHRLLVRGTIHGSDYSHATPFIQQDGMNLVVTDTYITIEVMLAGGLRDIRILHEMIPTTRYHFLVDVPTLRYKYTGPMTTYITDPDFQIRYPY